MISYISRRIVKAKRIYWCAVCRKQIVGLHVYTFGDDSYTNKPYELRICACCALSAVVADDLREFSEKELLPILVRASKTGLRASRKIYDD